MTHHLSTFGGQAVTAVFTYDDPHLPADNGLDKKVVKNLANRLYNEFHRRQKRPFAYYIAGEYGKEIHTNRPHYHAVLYGLTMSKEDQRAVSDCWSNGYVQIKPLHESSMDYISKYVQKQVNGPLVKKLYGDRQPPFRKCTRGLGTQWALENAEQLKQNEGITLKGVPISLPTAYIKALNFEFSEEHKKRLEEENEEKLQEYLKKHPMDSAELSDVRDKSNLQRRLNQIAKEGLKNPKYLEQQRKVARSFPANGQTEMDKEEDARIRAYHENIKKGSELQFRPKSIPPASEVMKEILPAEGGDRPPDILSK